MNYCYYTTFQPVQTKRGVTQIFKNIPNHSLDVIYILHTIFNEHTSLITIQEPSKHKKNNFCLFLSIFVCRFCEHFSKIRRRTDINRVGPPLSLLIRLLLPVRLGYGVEHYYIYINALSRGSRGLWRSHPALFDP